jgi:hypothetical protein
MELVGPNIKQHSSIEYCCKKCTYNTVLKSEYDNHLLTTEHSMDCFGHKIKHTSSIEYYCENCDFKTVRKNNYETHLLTAKHKLKMSSNISSNALECKNCSKVYQTSSGLRKHNKKCCVAQQIADDDEPTSKELIMILIKENAELKSMMMDVIKNGTNNTITNSHNNNNNKTFNLQFFLNETCKDAMNLTDFINSIVLRVSDLDNIGEVGLAKGVANRLVSEMNLLGENKRPIHCTDLKREVMYVKDENKWQKDVNKEKMRHLIKKMNRKLNPLLVEFMKNHNKTYQTDSEIIKHQQKIGEIVGGNKDETTNEDEIIRNISKNVTISKEHQLL